MSPRCLQRSERFRLGGAIRMLVKYPQVVWQIIFVVSGIGGPSSCALPREMFHFQNWGTSACSLINIILSVHWRLLCNNIVTACNRRCFRILNEQSQYTRFTQKTQSDLWHSYFTTQIMLSKFIEHFKWYWKESSKNIIHANLTQPAAIKRAFARKMFRTATRLCPNGDERCKSKNKHQKLR